MHKLSLTKHHTLNIKECISNDDSDEWSPRGDIVSEATVSHLPGVCYSAQITVVQ
jgi:hypothetical protein